MRPGWDETWAAVARAIAARSACAKRQVGAVIVSADNRDHWVGYNGAPGGMRDDLEAQKGPGCQNYCPQGSGEPWVDRIPVGSFGQPGEWAPGPERPGAGPCVAIHAEVNALMQSDRRLRDRGTIYVTAAPCLKCALAIANSGVSRLVCPDWERDRRDVAALIRRVYWRTPRLTIDTDSWRNE